MGTHIVDIRGIRPLEEIDAYLLATGNFFPLVNWNCCLLALNDIQTKLDKIGVLLESFGADWRLAQHAAVFNGQLVAAVVQTRQTLLFGGECFPHEEFHEHALRIAGYLGSLADLNEHPNSPEHQRRYHDATRGTFPVEPDSRTLRRLKSLTRSGKSTVSIETGSGKKTVIDLPERGRLARENDANEGVGFRRSRLKIARIENAGLVHLADGSIAITATLSHEIVSAAEYLEHDLGMAPTRKVIWEGKAMRILTSDQLPLTLQPDPTT